MLGNSCALGVGATSHPRHKEPATSGSLTSHFDGHRLLGADQVDDFLMGTGGDGIAIDPDNLIPDLGRPRDGTSMEERRLAVEQAHTRCSQPQKGLSPGKKALMCAPAPCHSPTALQSQAMLSVSGWRNQGEGWGWGEAGSVCEQGGGVIELRQDSGLCPLILVPLSPY